MSKLYLSNFSLGMWEVVFCFLSFFLMGQQLQEHFHLPGIYKEEKYLKGQRSNIMEKHFEPEFREEEEKTAGVMEMDTIKTGEKIEAKQEKDWWDMIRGVFLFWRLTCCPSLPSLSLSSPRADLSPACSDGLESVPGKTGHPSPPPSSHPTSISPLAHLPRRQNLSPSICQREREQEKPNIT